MNFNFLLEKARKSLRNKSSRMFTIYYENIPVLLQYIQRIHNKLRMPYNTLNFLSNFTLKFLFLHTRKNE